MMIPPDEDPKEKLPPEQEAAYQAGQRIGKIITKGWTMFWEWVGQPLLFIVLAGLPTVFSLNEIFSFGLPYSPFKIIAAGLPWFLFYMVVYLATPASSPSMVRLPNIMIPMPMGMGLPGEQPSGPSEGDGGHGPH